MQFINYFFASLTSFLGLLIGSILIRIAPEEKKPLEKYFVLGRKALLWVIFAFLMFYYFGNWIYSAVLLLLIAFLLLIEYKSENLVKTLIATYVIFGILFYLSSNNLNLFTIESSLILLYGLPTASLAFDRKKNPYKLFFYSIGFIIISNLLFLSPLLISDFEIKSYVINCYVANKTD